MLRFSVAFVVLLGASRAMAAPTNESADRAGEAPPRPLRIGPLLGLGFPRPFTIGAFGKIHDLAGVGLEYSFLPKVGIAGAETSFRAVAADARVFPFRGPLFFGLRAGHQWLDARATMSGFTETLDASTWFVNPRIGLLYTWSSGMTVGFDAGVQIPIAPVYARSGPATDRGLAEGTDTEATLRSVANVLGNKVTPTVDLLRVGFLF